MVAKKTVWKVIGAIIFVFILVCVSATLYIIVSNNLALKRHNQRVEIVDVFVQVGEDSKHVFDRMHELDWGYHKFDPKMSGFRAGKQYMEIRITTRYYYGEATRKWICKLGTNYEITSVKIKNISYGI